MTMEDNKTLVEQLKGKMREGEVQFIYKKKNGEERMALGTLNKDLYGKENEPKGTDVVWPENVVRYYDMNSAGWRSFIAENLVSVETNVD